MGFDVFGPTRHVRASNIDDGEEPRYDVLAMPREYGLVCPQLEKLSGRFYDLTTLRFAEGHVNALQAELVQVQQVYRTRRESELITQRGIHARNPRVRQAIIDRVLQEDSVYRTLEELRLLCEEAIAAEANVRCVGD